MAYFAASVDPLDTNKRFAKELGISYPLLSDPGGVVASAYGVLDPDAKVAHRWTFYIGKDGVILSIDRKVHPLTAGPDLAAHLEALGIKPGS